jgi:hypothetical protein
MLQASELTAKEKLPVKFLEQIFMQLKAADYASPPDCRENYLKFYLRSRLSFEYHTK